VVPRTVRTFAAAGPRLWGLPPVELSSSPTTQSGHHLRTVQTIAEGTPFSGWRSVTLICGALEEHLLRAYLLIYSLMRIQQEVQLLQRDRATLYVCRNLVNCFTTP